MNIYAIAAVDSKWNIGCRGKLLVSIPGDMKFFREKTMGNTVIMGRVTLESFPDGKPLKGRNNVVITGNRDLEVKGADIAHDPESALKIAGTYGKDIYVIGGEQIYRQLLPYCSKAYITKIEYEYEADAVFPDLDNDPEWEIEETGEEQSCFDLIYRFVTYRRK